MPKGSLAQAWQNRRASHTSTAQPSVMRRTSTYTLPAESCRQSHSHASSIRNGEPSFAPAQQDSSSDDRDDRRATNQSGWHSMLAQAGDSPRATASTPPAMSADVSRRPSINAGSRPQHAQQQLMQAAEPSSVQPLSRGWSVNSQEAAPIPRMSSQSAASRQHSQVQLPEGYRQPAEPQSARRAEHAAADLPRRLASSRQVNFSEAAEHCSGDDGPDMTQQAMDKVRQPSRRPSIAPPQEMRHGSILPYGCPAQPVAGLQPGSHSGEAAAVPMRPPAFSAQHASRQPSMHETMPHQQRDPPLQEGSMSLGPGQQGLPDRLSPGRHASQSDADHHQVHSRQPAAYAPDQGSKHCSQYNNAPPQQLSRHTSRIEAAAAPHAARPRSFKWHEQQSLLGHNNGDAATPIQSPQRSSWEPPRTCTVTLEGVASFDFSPSKAQGSADAHGVSSVHAALPVLPEASLPGGHQPAQCNQPPGSAPSHPAVCTTHPAQQYEHEQTMQLDPEHHAPSPGLQAHPQALPHQQQQPQAAARSPLVDVVQKVAASQRHGSPRARPWEGSTRCPAPRHVPGTSALTERQRSQLQDWQASLRKYDDPAEPADGLPDDIGDDVGEAEEGGAVNERPQTPAKQGHATASHVPGSPAQVGCAARTVRHTCNHLSEPVCMPSQPFMGGNVQSPMQPLAFHKNTACNALSLSATTWIYHIFSQPASSSMLSAIPQASKACTLL